MTKGVSSWKKGFNSTAVFDYVNSIRKQSKGKVRFAGLDFNDPLFDVIATNINHNYLFSYRTCRSLARKALFKPTKHGPLSSQTFLHEFDIQSKSAPPKVNANWHIVTSLSYKKPFPFKALTIDDVIIEFCGVTPKKYIIDGGIEQLADRKTLDRFLRPEHVPYPAVIIQCTGSTANKALSNGFLSAEKIRGIINWYSNRKIYSRWSTGIPKPLNSFRWGRIHTLHNSNGTSAYKGLGYEPDFMPVDKLGELGDPKKFSTFYKRVRAKAQSSPIRDTFWEGVARYNEALDDPDWAQSFLRLWSTLELLTGTGKLSYDITISRAASCYSSYAYHREVLNYLRLIRNRIAHEGFKIDRPESLLFNMKRYVEVMLEFVLGNSFKFETIDELGQFLDLPKNKERLLRAIHLAESAMRYRNF